MGELAVLAQAFAVIGGDDDERRPRHAGNAIEERRERVIGPRDLGRVGVAGIPCRKGVGRRIGRMRIEHVHPGEPLRRLRAAPLQRRRDDGIGAPLGQGEVDAARRLADAIVVGVEPGVQAEALIEREAADEGAGREARRFSFAASVGGSPRRR